MLNILAQTANKSCYTVADVVSKGTATDKKIVDLFVSGIGDSSGQKIQNGTIKSEPFQFEIFRVGKLQVSGSYIDNKHKLTHKVAVFTAPDRAPTLQREDNA
jgi:hypothetical protein